MVEAKVFIVDVRENSQMPEAPGRVQSRENKQETEHGQQTGLRQGYLEGGEDSRDRE